MTEMVGEMVLGQTRVGHTYELVGLDAGERLRERARSMGLNSGSRFQVIANSGHGPIGIYVRRTKLVIGRGMSAKIRVREIESA